MQRNAQLIRAIQDDFQIVRRPCIGRTFRIFCRAHLQIRLPRPGGQNHCPHCLRGAVKHHAGGGQMIGKTVLHNIARTNPGGMQKPAKTSPVTVGSPRFVNRSRRLKNMGCIGDQHTPERRHLRLPATQVRLAKDR